MKIDASRVSLSLVWILSGLVMGVQPARAESAFDRLEFLLGKWKGVADEKSSALGAGQGGFSFELELSRKIIVRRNDAAYDSGQHHEDLMVIYLEAPEDTPRAIYFDSEGHVIRYRLAFPAPNSVTFESEKSEPGPRYRLSYLRNGASLDGKFEVAPPGAEYQTYLSWTSKKE